MGRVPLPNKMVNYTMTFETSFVVYDIIEATFSIQSRKMLVVHSSGHWDVVVDVVEDKLVETLVEDKLEFPVANHLAHNCEASQLCS